MSKRMWVGLGAAVGSATLTGAGAVGWAFLQTSKFVLRRVEAPVLPAGAEPLRVLHVSDMHLVPTQRRKVEWVRELAALEPDLVISTGDSMADGAALPTVLEAMEGLLQVPGAFVLGSNDYYSPRLKNPAHYLVPDARRTKDEDDLERLPTEAMVEAFATAGWLELSNSRGALEIGDLRVDLVGLDDPHLKRDAMPPRLLADDEIEAGVTHESGDAGEVEKPTDGAVPPTLRLGIVHAPYTRALNALQDDGVDMVLAGHTHGGQLCLPGGHALVTNCDLDRGRASGLHGWPGERPDQPGSEGSIWLHVSAGLGTSPFAPVRFACPPEATLLTLVPRG